MRWLVYALGGGLGHLTRGLALARAAGRQGIRVTLLTNSPFASALPVRDELHRDDHLIIIPAESDLQDAKRQVRDVIRNSTAQLLIVDTFPRGLGGELADLLPTLSTPSALIHRDLNPRYVESFELSRSAAMYDLLLSPGETGPLKSARTHCTLPWLIRDADELLAIGSARRQLGLRDHDARPVALISGCGRAAEIQELAGWASWLARELEDRVHIRFCSPASSSSADLNIWPLLPLLTGVDILIGAGGYNTVNEARVTGTPLVALARPRMYDRQLVRLAPHETFTLRDELPDRILSLSASSDPVRRQSPPAYSNGAHQAVKALLTLVERPPA